MIKNSATFFKYVIAGMSIFFLLFGQASSVFACYYGCINGYYPGYDWYWPLNGNLYYGLGNYFGTDQYFATDQYFSIGQDFLVTGNQFNTNGATIFGANGNYFGLGQDYISFTLINTGQHFGTGQHFQTSQNFNTSQYFSTGRNFSVTGGQFNAGGEFTGTNEYYNGNELYSVGADFTRSNSVYKTH